MKKNASSVILFFLTLAVTFAAASIVEPKSFYIVRPEIQSPTNYPKWAHYQWVWLHNSEITQDNILALVEGYVEHDIPVGAVNIDSTWSTQFNNFVMNTNKFPEFPTLVSEMHQKGVKVTLWVTSMVNVEDPDFDMCVEKKYLVRNSQGEVRPLKWWHGSGGLLDYSNPEAVQWWHQQMDLVLNAGVDGFKCDGTDPYILEYSKAGGAYGYDNQLVTYRDYADAYYRDFLLYTRQKRGGDNGLIMSRPVDCEVDQPSKVCFGFSPKDVLYSGWVGDDDATFQGLRGCAQKVLYSAWDGYANFGCDIGGYRGNSDTKDKELFIRWAQFGAFLPLMENGGGGEHRPWMYDDETVSIYRKFAKAHHRMSPYLHTMGANAMDSGSSTLKPLADRHQALSGMDIQYPEPKVFVYRLGDDILVNPILRSSDSNLTSVEIRDAVFPTIDNKNTVWLSWWHPTDTKMAQVVDAHEGQKRVVMVIPLDSYPVHVRRGALLPLESTENAAKTVFTWFCPDISAMENDSKHPKTAILRESESTGSGMLATAYISANSSIEVTISARPGPVGFEIVGVTKPSDVLIESGVTGVCVHEYITFTESVLVSCKDNSRGTHITVTDVASSLKFDL